MTSNKKSCISVSVYVFGQLVEEQSTVSRLQRELQEAEHQRDLLGTRVAALNCDIQQKDCMQLTEQDEVHHTKYLGKTVSGKGSCRVKAVCAVGVQ